MNDLALRSKRWVKPVDSISIADALETYACPPDDTRGITLICGFGAFSAKTYSAPVTLPIGIAYLAATLEKAGYTVDLIDGIGENITGFRKSACGKYLYQGWTTDEIVARLKPGRILRVVRSMMSGKFQPKSLCEQRLYDLFYRRRLSREV